MGAGFAILTAVFFGATTVVVRLALRRDVRHEIAAFSPLIVAAAICAPIGLISLLVTGAQGAGGLWRFALIGLVAPGASQLVFFPAVRYAGAARVGILIGMAPVISAGLAIGLLGEPFRIVLAAATLMIVVGGIVLAWDPSRPEGFRPIGLVYGAASAVIFSVQAVAIRWASEGRSIPPFTALGVMVAAAVAVPLLALLAARGRTAFEGLPHALRVFLPSGLMYAGANVGFVLAYRYGQVIVVSPLTATESLWTVALAAVLLGVQRDAISRHVVGACALIVVGGILVGVYA